jgi:hypothetical protein
MAKRNRITLKKFFVRGKMPTEEHFSDLIDSMLNIVDEGFEKTPKNGLSLAPLDEEGHVASIFQKIEDEESKWSITLEKGTGKLVIRQFDGTPLLVLSEDGKVGIGTEEPRFQLQTSETAGFYGRAGTFTAGEVPADSYWHNVTDPLDGCYAFEVMAGCGKQQYGKYALLVATAVQCFGAHPRIRKTQSFYGSRFNKIMIRWRKVNGKSILQMKTRYNYGPGILISYNISSLWDNHGMFRNQILNPADGQ